MLEQAAKLTLLVHQLSSSRSYYGFVSQVDPPAFSEKEFDFNQQQNSSFFFVTCPKSSRKVTNLCDPTSLLKQQIA